MSSLAIPRRGYFGETDADINKKMKKAFEHGLTPIMCCGESLEQREQGVTMDFIRQQVKIGFQGLTADQAKEAVIAYEPIWASEPEKQLLLSRLRKFAARSVNASLRSMTRQPQKLSVSSTVDL